MKNWFKGFGVLFILILAIIISGPRPTYESIDGIIEPLDIEIGLIDSFIIQKEGKIENLKTDNEAKIIWADSSKMKTHYSVVYLHGFSASQEEGDPVHFEFAKRYGLNLFL